LVKGFKEGPEVTTSYKHAYSEVWREFWAVAQDIGVDNISIRKVQAHLDPDKIPRGTPAWVDAVGNGVADHWAKEGALLHPGAKNKEVASRRKAVDNTVIEACRWIAKRAAQANEDPRDCSGKSRPRRARTGEARVQIVHDVAPLTASPGWHHCRSCGMRATRAGKLTGGTCHGHLLVAQTVHISHNLLAAPGLVMCTKCGAYASHHGRFLRQPCRQATKTGKRNIKAFGKGVHPLSGEALAGEDGAPAACLPSTGPALRPQPVALGADEDRPPPRSSSSGGQVAHLDGGFDCPEADPWADLDGWLSEAGHDEPWEEILHGPDSWEEDPWMEPP